MLTRWLRFLRRGAAAPEARASESRPRSAAAASGEQAAAACHAAAALISRGRYQEAEVRLREAIDLKHDLAEAHYWLGAIHEQRGERDDAADCYQLAAHFDPGLTAAHFALAVLHEAQGRHADAAEHYRLIIEADPENSAAHTNLCIVLREMAEHRAALDHGERAVELDPELAEAHHNLALVLLAVGEPRRAADHLQRALRIKPLPEIAAGLAHAYRDLGQLDEAIAAYDRALAMAPGFGDAVINRAYAFLLKGDYRNGWDGFEQRFAANRTKVRDFGLPGWTGEPLRDKTILVHAEQGVGDEIMFASCIPELVAAAHRVVIECSDRLAPLYRRSFPQALVHGGKKEDSTDWVARFAPVHYQVPVGSLARHFRSEAAAFSRAGAYLRADPQRVREWGSRLGGAPGRLAVGLSWRGGTPQNRGRVRSIPLEQLHGLLRTDVDFVSLQHGAVASELQWPGASIRSFPGLTDDLDGLAALMCALDLVVSVDNTNVQLAGALGRPLWVLLSPSPEWRYGLGADTMPWYPSARLFRREHGQNWEPVVARLARQLDELRAGLRPASAVPWSEGG